MTMVMLHYACLCLVSLTHTQVRNMLGEYLGKDLNYTLDPDAAIGAGGFFLARSIFGGTQVPLSPRIYCAIHMATTCTGHTT
jgi:hypothetical protein